MAEQLPDGLNEADVMRWRCLPNGERFDTLHCEDLNAIQNLMNGSNNVSKQLDPSTLHPAPASGISGLNSAQRINNEVTGLSQNGQNHTIPGLEANTERVHNYSKPHRSRSMLGYLYRNDSRSLQKLKNGSMPRSPAPENNQVEAEWIEQYEPGVYITLIALQDGMRGLKRVRFSRRNFGEKQAETWWSENRTKVYEKFNVRDQSSSLLSLSAQS